jgi:DNA polymerase/3'-5' exonuclease PolX
MADPQTQARWPLADAERIAADLIERLKPVCEQVMLCGSIRRRRPTVGDIDIVAVPRLANSPGLFGGHPGAPPVCLVHQWACRLCETGGAAMVANGPRLIRLSVVGQVSNLPDAQSHEQRQVGNLPYRIGVDLYVAAALAFPMTAFLRTGSAEHNRTLAARCIERGLRLQVAEGRIVHDARDMALARPLELHPAGDAQADYERAVYEALGLAPLWPHERDPDQGNWVRSHD